jgi:hypothetical protein
MLSSENIVLAEGNPKRMAAVPIANPHNQGISQGNRRGSPTFLLGRPRGSRIVLDQHVGVSASSSMINMANVIIRKRQSQKRKRNQGV